MKRRIVSILICFIISLATVSFFGCEGIGSGDIELYEEGMAYTETKKGEVQPFYSLSYDIMGGADVMPVGGYYGLYQSGGSVDGNNYANYLEPEFFDLASQIGINMIVYTCDRADSSQALFKKWYQLGDEYGIGIFANCQLWENKIGDRIKDPRLNADYVAPTRDWLYNLVKTTSFDFSYKSFLGLWGMDEAYANHQLDILSELVPMFYDCGLPEHLDVYSNALGYWDGLTNVSNTFIGGGWTYDEYMFTGKSGINKDGSSYSIPSYFSAGYKMLSTTQYPIASGTTDYEQISTWFQKLAYLVKIANDEGMPYWRMMQCGGYFGFSELVTDYFPYEGQWMLDFNSALAFGCKGIQFFEMCNDFFHSQVPGGYDFGKNGLFGIDGKPNKWFYYAKNAVKQLQAIDNVLMNSANMGILPFGKDATALIGNLETSGQLISAKGWRELKSLTGDDCFVGCFDYKGGTALYVVNSNTDERCDVRLNFNDRYRYDVTQRGEKLSVVGTSIPLSLSPGEAAMIVLY